MMALAPAYHMARELPESQRALPVLKVLYRNTNRIQENGGAASREVLHPVAAEPLSAGQPGGEALRDAVRGKNMDLAERTFAALAGRGPDDAFNDLLYAVQDNTEVHRVVLPYRAWDLLDADRPGARAYAAAAVGPLLRQERARLESRRPEHGPSRASSCPSCSTSITWPASRWARARPTTPGSTG